MKTPICFIDRAIVLLCLFLVSLQGYNQRSGLQAVPDTIDIYPGIPAGYDILANDIIPAGDTVRMVLFGGKDKIACTKTHDSAFHWTFTFSVIRRGFNGPLELSYKIVTMSFDTSSAPVLFRIHDPSYANLDINNVSARFNAYGPHFFYEDPEYEVPKGSGKTSLFSHSLWIGGKDSQGMLHLAGEKYGQGPSIGNAGTKHDFYAGPVMDSIHYSVYQDTLWNHVWNLKKSEIDYHREHFWEAGYYPIRDILTWPGNGNPLLGQSARLAPFSDRNGDGIYNPFDGDYPEIRGDQALFWIKNDDRANHTETEGKKLRVEIHEMAYAFDLPGDSAFLNTVFLHCKVFNRSQNTYDSTLFGFYTDIDLGYPNDDFVGCDVERGMYYGYNGNPVDGTGQSYAYGANPPVQSVTLLAGPLLEPDGIDNPEYGQLGQPLCDLSVNGMFFADEIIDNERMGLQLFSFIKNTNAGVPSYGLPYPAYAEEYYQVMRGYWRDETPIVYGGAGHPLWGGYGPACRFMYPGESDTLNWGVGCAPPNGPVNWTEITALNNPQDRRGVGVTGPITFHPGEAIDLDLAFTWARDYSNGTEGSLAILRQYTDHIRSVFGTNQLPNGNPFYGILTHMAGPAVKVYPVPASDVLTVSPGNQSASGFTRLELLDCSGRCLKSVSPGGSPKPVRLNVSEVPAGFYLLRVATREAVTCTKIAIVR